MIILKRRRTLDSERAHFASPSIYTLRLNGKNKVKDEEEEPDSVQRLLSGR